MRQFEIGEDVLALNLRDGPKWLKARITHRLGNNVYHVCVFEILISFGKDIAISYVKL